MWSLKRESEYQNSVLNLQISLNIILLKISQKGVYANYILQDIDAIYMPISYDISYYFGEEEYTNGDKRIQTTISAHFFW